MFFHSAPETPLKSKPSDRIKVQEGSTATIECNLPRIAGTQVQWLKGNKPVTASKRVNITKTADKTCLVVERVTPGDQDSYTCVLTNKKDVSKTTVYLDVVPKESDVTFTQEMEDLEVNEGDDAKFDVRVDGRNVEVDWYRDDELLEDAGRIIIEDPHPDGDDNLYSLTIENCGPKDTGMSCTLILQSTLV